MSKQKIEPCPFCGHIPTVYPDDPVTLSHDGNGCRFDNVPFLIDEWNDLCELVKKGRKDDEAVRLLRDWMVFDRNIDKCKLNTGQFLARIDKKRGEG